MSKQTNYKMYLHYTVHFHSTFYHKDQSSVSKKRTSEKSEMVTCEDNTEVARICEFGLFEVHHEGGWDIVC